MIEDQGNFVTVGSMSKNDKTYQEFVKNLKVADLNQQHIIIWGQDDYLIQKAIDKISQNSNFEYVRHDSNEVTSPQLQDHLTQTGLFAPATCLILRRTEKDKSLPKKLKTLQIHPRNRVILTLQATSIPKNLIKAFPDFQEIPCFSPKSHELPKFVLALAKSLGLELNLALCESILELTGEDLNAIDNELRVLALAYDQFDPTDADRIFQHIQHQKQESPFRISDLLLRQETAKASALLEQLIKQGEAPLAILGLLAKHCRTTLSFQLGLLPQGYIPRAQQGLYRSYAKNISKQSCKNALLSCAYADQALKSSVADPCLLLNQVILDLHSKSP